MVSTARAVLPVLAVLAALAAGSPRAAAQEAPPPAAAAPPAWLYPQEVKAQGRRLSLQEPSVVSYDGPSFRVELRFAACSTDPLGRVAWGAVTAKGSVHVDFASRLVLVDEVGDFAVAFPGVDEKESAALLAAVAEGMPKTLLLRLELLTSRPGAFPADAPQPKFASDPPQFFVRLTPAVLVQIDGEPVLLDVVQFPLQYVANTASDVFRDPKTDTWYLLLDGTWLQAKAVLGPWTPLEGQVPTVLTQLPADHPRGHIRRFVPGTPEYNAARREASRPQPGAPGKPPAPAQPAPAAKQLPEIIVSDKPAELVLLKGDPLMTWVPGIRLMLVANTESDLFFHPKSGFYWLLVSGRWFTADDVEGPWKANYAPVPEEFAKIPRDHVRGHVVWCVPGTPEAAEACALAALEERATLNKFAPVQVLYEGKDIVRAALTEGVEVVANTEDDCFVVGGAFYVCQRGGWYRSEDGRGQWQPVVELPEALRRVTEGSGSWHVLCARPLGIEGDGATFAVSGGWLGTFASKGAPVFGTGWSRRGAIRNANWYPFPRTYGESRWYDPQTGCFQPRTVRYREEGPPAADEWSPYTASYGRVRVYAGRYDQGGRRMFPYEEGRGFDTSAGRPDLWGQWFGHLKRREGFEPKAFPFGSREGEKAPAEPQVIADETGAAWRNTPAGPETFDKGKWTAAKPSDEILARLQAIDRVNARPVQWRTWRARRAAAVPVNPVVTPRAR